LLYSARFNRRIVTRPGFPGRPQLSRSSADLIQAVSLADSSAVGWGRSSGGIIPPSTYSRTRSQTRRRNCTSASPGTTERSSPPLRPERPWQSVQYLARKVLTCERCESGFAERGCRSLAAGGASPAGLDADSDLPHEKSQAIKRNHPLRQILASLVGRGLRSEGTDSNENPIRHRPRIEHVRSWLTSHRRYDWPDTGSARDREISFHQPNFKSMWIPDSLIRVRAKVQNGSE
jgi:hypothetical protein